VFHRCYLVKERLKSGGMGHVYVVEHTATFGLFALKTMTADLVSDASLRARFLQEARVTAQINSEHLVKVFDAGIDDETSIPFLVMELLHGEDLAALIERKGPLAAREVATLLWQASLALDKAHDAGIVHRDLKPANLFRVFRDNGEPCLKILDFGIAKVVESHDGNTTRSVGTPLYMPPEQFGGQLIDRRADIYALGHVAFTLLTGHAFWEPEFAQGNVFELVSAMARQPARDATVRAQALGVKLPARFDAWFRRATAYKVADRPDTASELVGALHDVYGLARPRQSQLPRAVASTPSSASTLELAPTLVAQVVEPKKVRAPGSISWRGLGRGAGLVGLLGAVVTLSFRNPDVRQKQTPSQPAASTNPAPGADVVRALSSSPASEPQGAATQKEAATPTPPAVARAPALASSERDAARPLVPRTTSSARKAPERGVASYPTIVDPANDYE
jgi:serine/threonine-protein kinase